MKKIASFVLIASLISTPVIAENRILTNPSQPYESLGVVEEKACNRHHFLKFLTFGLLRKRNYARITRELDKKLLKEASKKYGADAIANVTYWPEPNSGETIHYVYGRAEMIRFKKFPVKVTAPEIPAAEVEPATL